MTTASNSPVVSERAVVLALFFLLFAGNMYFVSPSIAGVPIRFLYSALITVFICAVDSRARDRALRRATWFYLWLGYLALVGFMLSAVRDGIGPAAAMLVSEHVQAAIIFTAVVVGTTILGQRAMTAAFVLAVGISVLFSLLQGAGLGPALAIRDYLGTFQFQSAADEEVMATRYAGLSYSAIVLANQMCLAFAAIVVSTFIAMGGRTYAVPELVRRYAGVIVAGLVMIVACVVQGNRSPILGLLFFAALLPSARRRARLMFLVPVIVVGIVAVGPVRELLSGSDLRVASVGDKSEAARNPLIVYGWRLFLNNPLGYGITFDSKTLSNTVATTDLNAITLAQHLEGVLEGRDLHDYWLTALNMYGVFVLPLLVVLLGFAWRWWAYTVAFVPYLVHITFHNVAPLTGDYMFWVPVAIMVAGVASRRAGKRAPRQPRSAARPVGRPVVRQRRPVAG